MCKKVLAMLILVGLSLGRLAEADQIPIDRKITQIQTYKDYVMLSISPKVNLIDNCGRAADYSHSKLILDIKSGVNDEVFTTALAAGVSEKNVGFEVSGCYNSSAYPSIGRIDVEF